MTEKTEQLRRLLHQVDEALKAARCKISRDHISVPGTSFGDHDTRETVSLIDAILQASGESNNRNYWDMDGFTFPNDDGERVDLSDEYWSDNSLEPEKLFALMFETYLPILRVAISDKIKLIEGAPLYLEQLLEPFREIQQRKTRVLTSAFQDAYPEIFKKTGSESDVWNTTDSSPGKLIEAGIKSVLTAALGAVSDLVEKHTMETVGS